MKEDYLWDKSGSDPEVERIEGLLSEFRFAEKARPLSNIVEFPSKTRYHLGPWAFAMAACLAVGAVAIGIWNLGDSASTSGTVETAVVADESPTVVGSTPILPEAESEKGRVTVSTPLQKAAFRVQRTSQQRSTPLNIRRRESRSPKLTEEEKYAYGQLMLALSITSSKLQIVKDQIHGVDETNTNDK